MGTQEGKGYVAILISPHHGDPSRFCFWGQVLRKYLRGTQGRPDLCFSGFGTYREPNLLYLCDLPTLQYTLYYFLGTQSLAGVTVV